MTKASVASTCGLLRPTDKEPPFFFSFTGLAYLYPATIYSHPPPSPRPIVTRQRSPCLGDRSDPYLLIDLIRRLLFPSQVSTLYSSLSTVTSTALALTASSNSYQYSSYSTAIAIVRSGGPQTLCLSVQLLQSPVLVS